MNSDKETLTRSFEEIRTKVTTAQKYAYDREMAVSKRGDSLETYIGEYMTLAYKLGLHPPPRQIVLDRDGREVEVAGEDFSMDLNLAGTTPYEILGGDVNGRIRPGLMRFSEGKRAHKRGIDDEIIRVEYQLDRLLQIVEGLKEDADILDAKVKGTAHDAEAAKLVRPSSLQRFPWSDLLLTALLRRSGRRGRVSCPPRRSAGGRAGYRCHSRRVPPSPHGRRGKGRVPQGRVGPVQRNDFLLTESIN